MQQMRPSVTNGDTHNGFYVSTQQIQRGPRLCLREVKKEIASNSAALEQATKVREKETAEFSDDEKDMMQSSVIADAVIVVGTVPLLVKHKFHLVFGCLHSIDHVRQILYTCRYPREVLVDLILNAILLPLLVRTKSDRFSFPVDACLSKFISLHFNVMIGFEMV